MSAHSFSAFAFYNPQWQSLDDIKAGTDRPMVGGSKEHVSDGWVFLGECTVFVDIKSDDEIHAERLATLNRELSAVRAENQQRENRLLTQISKLQALTYSEAA